MDERVWKDLLERYGQRVTLVRAGERTPVRAFFQQVREKEEGWVPTPLGGRPLGRYLYLGPPEEALEEVDALEWNGGSYRLIRVRETPVGERTAYRWALAEEMDRGSGA